MSWKKERLRERRWGGREKGRKKEGDEWDERRRRANKKGEREIGRDARGSRRLGDA